MSFSTHAVGTAMLALIMQGAWEILGPSLPPIVVHSLTYEEGFIVQDRTVHADGKFTAVWAAVILDKKTGLAVPDCQGTGSWDYQAGHKVIEIPLAEWVGNPQCDLGPGTYIPMARYSAGEFLEIKRGEEFTLPGVSG